MKVNLLAALIALSLCSGHLAAAPVALSDGKTFAGRAGDTNKSRRIVDG